MSGAGTSGALRFREVLGQYPTGVTVVAATDSAGRGLGLALGSFTSVSLDPPLVAFLADKGSRSWPRIRETGSFCVNVLAAEQEDICRRFASKAQDKFIGLQWRPAGSGSPIIDGVVAWIDCDIDRVHEEGDHFLVVGKVRELDIERHSLPLLFFRGGYGSFTPLSMAAIEREILDELRCVDFARPVMEEVASTLGVECTAAVLLGEELAYVARAGRAEREGVTGTRVGRRLPFIPPVGAVFAAWGAESRRQAWASHGRPGRRLIELDYPILLERVREQGYVLGLGHDEHMELFRALGEVTTGRGGHPEPRPIELVLHDLAPGYAQEPLSEDRSYDLRTISVPVFDGEEVVLQLTSYGFDRSMSKGEVEMAAAMLHTAAAKAGAAISNATRS